MGIVRECEGKFEMSRDFIESYLFTILRFNLFSCFIDTGVGGLEILGGCKLSAQKIKEKLLE